MQSECSKAEAVLDKFDPHTHPTEIARAQEKKKILKEMMDTRMLDVLIKHAEGLANNGGNH